MPSTSLFLKFTSGIHIELILDCYNIWLNGKFEAGIRYRNLYLLFGYTKMNIAVTNIHFL
jgi:hypothetical protein